MKILAIETSCDETAAAVVEDGTKMVSNVLASSTAMHEKYGGIVPEVAAREQLKCIIPVIREALSPFTNNQQFDNETIRQHIDALAVTVGPGLIGSLLVGVETAKTIAFVTGKPIIPVNHVLAHMYGNFIESDRQEVIHDKQNNSSREHCDNRAIAFPAISLVVSGGHTELFLMKSAKHLRWLGGTLDDAAGEAFDKTARLLGFGSRGGPAIQEAATTTHDPRPTTTVTLPRPMIGDKTFNFSFSGLKTAIIREWKKYPQHDETLVADFAHEVQEAITDVLVEKTLRAGKKYHAKSILVSGGVAANLRLREKFSATIQRLNNVTLHVPPISLCTDNAVYIASYAFFRGKPTHWRKVTAQPELSVEISSER